MDIMSNIIVWKFKNAWLGRLVVVRNSFIFLFSFDRHSPCPVRRPANPYKDSKPPNNRLSVAVRAQQRHSPRGANGDRSKPSKGKEKKESKEAKEAAGKAKDDKVSNMLVVSRHHLLLHNITQQYSDTTICIAG